MGFSGLVTKHASNILGWRSKRKLVVIESDDWGSIRMPGNGAFDRLKSVGVPVDAGSSAVYNKYDTLASADDFDGLFQTLLMFKDNNGIHPIFTAMSLAANPDFEKIRASQFDSYFYESFTTTLEKYGLAESIPYWKNGKEEGIFFPQFHGREHLNVNAWMRALQRKDPYTVASFNEGIWGFRYSGSSQVNFQAAFDLEKYDDIKDQQQIIASGLKLFEEIHGYKASFFVPPNGPFNNKLCKVASEGGIEFMSSPKIHLEPQGDGKFTRKFFYLGKMNEHKQLFLIRNAFFEPSLGKKDWVDACLNDIKVSFMWGKPAVISSHRVNYIGGHNEGNRINGLRELKKLLASILKNWPDAEFLSSVDLGRLLIGIH